MVGYPEVSQMSIEIIKKLNAFDIKCSTLTKGVSPFELSQLSKENEYAEFAKEVSADGRQKERLHASHEHTR